MDLFEYIIGTWTRCNYDRKRKYHIDFDFMKDEYPYRFTIQMWSSTQRVELECLDFKTGITSSIFFSYATCLEFINRTGIEKFLEYHKQMLINSVKNKEQ